MSVLTIRSRRPRSGAVATAKLKQDIGGGTFLLEPLEEGQTLAAEFDAVDGSLFFILDRLEAGVGLYEAAGYTRLARDTGGGVGPLALLARPKPRTLMGRASRMGMGSGGGVSGAAAITSISPNLLAMMAQAAAEEER